MHSHLPGNNYRPRKTLYSALLLTLLVLFLLSCSPNRSVKGVPKLSVAETTLAKDLKDVNNRKVLLTPTNTFTTQDNAVVAHVRLANLSGQHTVEWRWYSPDGKLYHAPDPYEIGTSKGKYAEEATLWHKISIKNNKAQHYPGEWTVKIILDGSIIATKYFDLNSGSPDMLYDVDADIPSTAMQNTNGIAVIIGNRFYQHQDIPAVAYAHNDAESMKRYLIEALGYKEGNIFLEKDITKARFEALFGIQDNYRGILYDYVKPFRSDIFIYYSGHGSPDLNKMKGYFVPADCDPSKIALNGYSLDLFYQNLSKMEARTITVVLDSCFSGGTNSGRYLIKSASPVLIRVDTANIIPAGAAVLTSSDGGQISSWYDEKGHGLFSYFFLKGIGGSADRNNDGQITFQEIHEYVADRSEGVPYWARRLHGGREQTPMLYGNRNEDVFVKF